VAAYSFTITEYDPSKPWIVVATSRDSIELGDDQHFYNWANERWPRPKFGVKLDTPPLKPWSY
jgi:hypothetical protein